MTHYYVSLALSCCGKQGEKSLTSAPSPHFFFFSSFFASSSNLLSFFSSLPASVLPSCDWSADWYACCVTFQEASWSSLVIALICSASSVVMDSRKAAILFFRSSASASLILSLSSESCFSTEYAKFSASFLAVTASLLAA